MANQPKKLTNDELYKHGRQEIHLGTKDDELQQFSSALDHYNEGRNALIELADRYDAEMKAAIRLGNREKTSRAKAKLAELLTVLEPCADRCKKLEKHLGIKPSESGSKASTEATKKASAEEEKHKDTMLSAVVLEKPNVKWDDVAGLEGAKQALKEAVMTPILFPRLFQGRRKPWRGILLYGPPGTGKSFLAKAVASAVQGTFFSVSSSDLVSKWMGESEKQIKALFTLAREQKPSVIFIDEIDALCGTRGEGESEAARRIKTEMLVQMDGVGRDNEGVLVLGATNIPWQLDAAIRRRFQRRVHITLPDIAARMRLFELEIGDTPNTLTKEDYKELAKMAQGYSGSDIATVVNQALLAPVSFLPQATHFKKIVQEGEVRLAPCSPGDPDAIEMEWTDVKPEDIYTPIVTFQDVANAIRATKPSVSQEDLTKNAEWTIEFGSEGA